MIEVRTLDRLADLPRADWDALVARCPDSTVFQTRAWLDPWWAAFGGADLEPRIFAAYEGGALVGVAPLCLARPARTLSWLGLGHSDYHTFPCVDAAPRIVDALLDAIAGALPAETVIELPEVPQFATLATCLAARAENPHAGVLRQERTICPRLQLDAEALALVNHKKSVRRGEHKLRDLGAARFERFTEAAAIEPMLEGFFEQHVRRWASTRFPSLFRRDENRRFYREALRSLAREDAVQFGVLWLDGRPVAQHFGMLSRGSLLWYKPTFDLEFARCSPGELLLRHLAVDAAAQGLRALDFTRGDESFKARFANAATYNLSFVWLRAASAARRARWAQAIRRPLQRLRAGPPRARGLAKRPRPVALVLDAHSTSGVEVLQSLGRAGAVVDIATASPRCLADRSRYVRERFEQPPADGAAFIAWLRERDARQGPYALIVPTTENSLLGLASLDESDPLRRRAVLAPTASLRAALNKEATLTLATRVGVPVPGSRLLASLAEMGSETEFPRVLKPVQSLVKTDAGHRRLAAVVVRDAAERDAQLRRMLPVSPVQEQEYFGGFGLGIECLYDRGRLVWAFAHERIHELPLTGGGSSYRRSRALHVEALWAARRLLDSLGWHGVAMVEFKLDRTGRICLMEINPRFWGSLALAIDAGVDFPRGLLRVATGAVVGPQPDYRTRYFTRHLAMDVDWMKENWRAAHGDPLLLTQPRVRSALEYLRPLVLAESHDHFSFRDPAVYLSQVGGILRGNLGAAWRRLVREPLFERRMRRQAREVVAAWGARPAKSVLFLCYGNICRSPFADLYARARGAALAIESAGFHPTGDRATPAHVVDAARALGVTMDRRSKVVDARMIAASDLVVVMDEDNLERTLAAFPAAARKTVMLGAIGGLPRVTIEDPYTMDEDGAREILKSIQRSVDRLLERLA